MKSPLTDKDKNFIKNNYTKMSRKQMAIVLKLKSVQPINTFMKKNDLKVSKVQSIKFRTEKMKGRTNFTQDEDNFIINNYINLPIKTIAKKLKRSETGVNGRIKSLRLIIPEDVLIHRKKQTQFKPGHTPKNKGKKQTEYMSSEGIENSKAFRFKKGNKSHNYLSVGTESVLKQGYTMVKIANPNVWELKHRLIYSEHYQVDLEKEDYIIFLDGNSQNFSIENLKKITQTESMYRNSKLNFPKEIIPSMVLVKQLEHKINTIGNGSK